MIILEGKHLTKTYGYDENKVIALNDVSLEIEEGSFVAVVGTSGSGNYVKLKIM